MACCYIAASMIAFIIRTCEALDIDLQLQYNESVKHDEGEPVNLDEAPKFASDEGITIASISGMTCAACTTAVESALLKTEGIQQALVSLMLQEVRVFHTPGLSKNRIISAIESVGYGASIEQKLPSQKIDIIRNTEELTSLKLSLVGLGAISTLVFGIGRGLDYLGIGGFFTHAPIPLLRALLLFSLVVIGAGKYGSWIFKHAAAAAFQARVNMHTLISASTVVGLSLALFNILRGNFMPEYFDTIIGVLLIISMGRYMDLLSRRQATNTFAGLYSLMDETSAVKLMNLHERVPTSILRAGDEIMIQPFTIIPCDGYVVNGTSHVNEAIITGESFPKTKTVGSLILAGSRNGSGELRAMVHQDYNTSFLSQLVESIEVSLGSKASAQSRVDNITRYFVSVIFFIGFSAASYSYFQARALGFDIAIETAGRKLMTILAAACPCALGLATPCAVMAGIDICWKNGILMLQGGETVELTTSITHVVMDKTGTLTLGRPAVSNMVINSDWKDHQKDLAVLVCAAEESSMSSHPLALAIFKNLLPICGEFWKNYKSSGRIQDLKETVGRGVTCEVDSGSKGWRTVGVGSLEFMKESNIKGLESIPQRFDEEGSVVFVSVDRKLAASIQLQDTLRMDSKTTIDRLKALNIEVSILTGDNAAESCRISQLLGIPVTASLATPDVKLEHIKQLQQKGHRVLMVGDGMNDGPSLAAAEVGVMMGHGRKCLSTGGSVLILHSELESLLKLLDISRSTTRQISANISWALTYNVIAVALAVGLGSPFNLTITPPMAATMMSVSSTFITLQGLLLKSRLSSRYNTSKS